MALFGRILKTYAPPYFMGRWMSTLIEVIGMSFDEHGQRVFDGRCAGNPYAGGSKTDDGTLRECEPEVLPLHASDREIALYSTEPIPSWRRRTGNWRELRRRKGSHLGEMINVQPFFLGTNGLGPLPVIKCVHQNNAGTPVADWHQLDASGVYTVTRSDPSNWPYNYSGYTSHRSDWWAIIHMPPGYTSGFLYDSGVTYDSGPVYDGLPADVWADLVAMFKESKASHSRLRALITTELQPTDTFPGGGFPFDPTATAVTDATGWTSLPVAGNWASPVYGPGPYFGHNTRPPWASWIYEDNT